MSICRDFNLDKNHAFLGVNFFVITNHGGVKNLTFRRSEIQSSYICNFRNLVFDRKAPFNTISEYRRGEKTHTEAHSHMDFVVIDLTGKGAGKVKIVI